MNLLLTSISGKINLIKYFRRALTNEAGGRLIGIDSDPEALGQFFLDDFFISPATNTPDYEEWFLKFVERERIAIVIPTRDGDLLPLTFMRKQLYTRFQCHAIVAASDIVKICLNKWLFADWCLKNGFRSIATLASSSINRNDLPLFIKPVSGAGAKKTLKIEHWNHWLEVKRKLDGSEVVQPYIKLPEYSVDLYVDKNGRIVSVVPRKRLKILHGESIHGIVHFDDKIVSEVTRLAQALALVGHNTVQCFRDEDSVIMIEVNTRFSGGVTLAIEAGADSPRYLIREYSGLAIDAPGALIEGLEMIRIQKDIFFGGDFRRKIYCFDLDGTICTESCLYQNALPIQKVIKKINELFHQGHEIIIATARGAASCNNWRPLIEQQLKDWGVNYHYLATSKPYADYYVDNKSVDVLEHV